MPNVSFLRNQLYFLKKDYGSPATLIQHIHEQTNTVTGERTVQRNILHLAKVVELPENMMRKFWYDVAFLKSNTNFTYGGEVDIFQKQIILDARDLKGAKLKQRDYIIMHHVRYVVEKATDMSHGLGYICGLKAADGTTPYDVISLKVQSRIKIAGGCANA